MLLWQNIILGIVEGVTEFLPISSTFHLLFASKMMGLLETDFLKFYSVFIQGAAILSVVVLFFREWLRDLKLLKNVAISFIPTGIVGFALHKVITGVFFESPALMLSAFAATGLVFLSLEFLIHRGHVRLTKTLDNITWPTALLIGSCQALAVLPGVSRAGAVMVVMMLMRYKRDEAAKFSFTLAIPTIMSAALFDLYKSKTVLATAGADQWLMLFVGCVFAFISALIITRWFIQFLRQHSLAFFAVYRLLAAGALVMLGFWR